ncbi:MAG: TadE/TadG family type IV pilus assembly protein [Chloroflexota bacterium]
MTWIDQTKQCVASIVRDERGVEAIELLGIIPLVTLILLVAWQTMLIGYTGIVAAEAAREGARAAVTGGNIDQAVTWGSPDFDGRRDWDISQPCTDYLGESVTVQVSLETPHVIFPFLGALSDYPKVTAKATMRCEQPFHASWNK